MLSPRPFGRPDGVNHAVVFSPFSRKEGCYLVRPAVLPKQFICRARLWQDCGGGLPSVSVRDLPTAFVQRIVKERLASNYASCTPIVVPGLDHTRERSHRASVKVTLAFANLTGTPPTFHQ
jgi:hypothetical protein